MNKSQLSKIIRYLFIEKDYGIKEVTNNEVWLLNPKADFPIICVVVYPHKKDNYYEEKYREYQKLLGTSKQLLLVNHENIVMKDYICPQKIEDTFLNNVVQSEYFQSDFPDYMLGMLQRQFQHKLGYASWISIFVGIISFIVYCVSLYVTNSEVSFLIGGYFRYAILNWHEYYRVITSIFSNTNLVLFIIYSIALYYYEYIFSIEHSHFRFGLILLFATLFSNIAFIYVGIEVVLNGLASSIMALATIHLLKFTLLWSKFPDARKNVRMRYIIIQYILLCILAVNDMPSFIAGGILGVFAFIYMRVKRDRILYINFMIAVMILMVGICVTTNEINTNTIDRKIYYKLKKNCFDIKYYENKVNRLEIKI